MPEPRQERLLNGLHILLWPDATAKKVTVRVRIHSGAAFDPQGKEGVMSMLAENIFPNENTREFFVEDLGGGLDIVTTYDYIEVAASSTPDNLLTLLETLSSAISNPTIDKETTASIRKTQTDRAAAREKNISDIADQRASARLFGAFPYGRPVNGSAQTIAGIEFADLIDARKKFLTADNATIAISGKFDRAYVTKVLRRYFGAWQKSDRRIPSTFRQPDEPPAAIETVPSPDPDAFSVRFAIRGVARSDKQFAASRVAAIVFADRLRSAVPPGHAGDLFVRSDAYYLPGVIMIGFDGRKGPVGSERVEINKILPDALTADLTESEFRSAKSVFQAEWSKTNAVTLWLDTDTYSTNGAANDAKLADRVTFDEVRTYMAALAKQPVASVLVNTPRTEQ